MKLSSKTALFDMKRKILICQPNFAENCPEALALLRDNGFDVDLNPYNRTYSFEELRSIVNDYSAVVSELERWDEKIFHLAKDLKILARFGAGLDNVDLKAAKQAGVTITYAKGVNAASVANMAIGLMLAALRKISFLDHETKCGRWLGAELGCDLDGKKIGLLGFGEIARQAAKRLRGFDVEVFAFDACPNSEAAAELSVQLTSLQTILQTCDVISLHLPHTAETHHIINGASIAMMKKNAILINTARGKLIDENALFTALAERAIAGAALDVFEEEPLPSGSKLLNLPNLICTPHVSGNTVEACEKVGLRIARDIIAFFEGKTPELLVQ